MAEAQAHHPPGWLTLHVANPIMIGLTKLGISVAGSRALEVTGRKSGQPRRTPVNLLEYEGGRYLVAPRGQVQWVKNVRVEPKAKLLKGSKAEEITLSEITDESERVPLLRAYLEKWKWEVGAFFDGVGPDASDEELAKIAPDHPTFKVEKLH
jgi:deazaflavin-dependent oxidoreductase (nitroreductase family)